MNVPILITVRLKSTRLPLKAIRRLGEGSLITHLIQRLRNATRVSSIAICTSDLATDDPLEWISQSENIACFRGDAEDVLARLTAAAEKFGAKTIISCTGDNPFVDPAAIDQLIEFHLERNHDFTRIVGLPLGAFSYAAETAAMRAACLRKSERDTEGWGKYLMDSRFHHWGTLTIKDDAVSDPDLRLTVDTPEDLTFAREIAKRLPSTSCPLADIVNLCRINPELRQINAHVVQRPLS